MDHDNMVHEHIRLIADNESRSKSNKLRLDNMEKLVESVHNLSMAFTSQAKDLSIMVETQKQHEEKIDHIQAKMETKDTVLRLHERIDDLEKKDGKRAEQLINQVRNILIGLITVGIAGVVWALIAN